MKEQVILDAINVQELIASAAGRKITELHKLLRATCSHPTTYIRETYDPGSYYDREAWHREEACNYCKCTINDLGSIVGGYG